jgi:hypothetical protein
VRYGAVAIKIVKSVKTLLVACLLSTLALVPAAPAEAAVAYAPRDVAAGSRPYDSYAVTPRRHTGVVDGTGVRMYLVGSTKMDHPVAQAQYGLQLLNAYRVSHDTWFLTMAERQALRLLNRKVVSRGAWWYPYPFTFHTGSGIASTMSPPWYSGMAQGQALSLFVRLAEVTGGAGWSQAADATFTSLALGYSATEPWATWRDDRNQLWLEEYPDDTTTTSGRVLNGHMFAIFGVWDYWRTTRSATAAAIFDAALRTVHTYLLSRFRDPGWASRYSLRGLRPSEKYHLVHIGQLLAMQALTGDPEFATAAEILHRDFSAPVQVTTIRFAGGRHIGVRFSSTVTGRVTARRTIGLGAVSSAPVDQRRRIGGQPGYWYHVTAGALTGYWVQEMPDLRATAGPVAVISYAGPRQVRLAAGGYTGYTAAHRRSVSVYRVSTAPVTAIGWIDGRESVYVSAGMLRGYWLPLSAGTTLG